MAKRKSYPNNRIAEHRKARGFTQQQLADAVGSHWITISKLERGVMRLSDDWRILIADALGVDEWDLVVGARTLPLVHVEAMIDEGGVITALGDDNTGEAFQISTDYFTTPLFRWVVVAGDALWPWYQDGDRLCFRDLPEDRFDEVRNRLCIAWYKNSEGEGAVVAGILKRGRTHSLHTIDRFGSTPISNVKLDNLAVVTMAVFYNGPDAIFEPVDLVPPLGTDQI